MQPHPIENMMRSTLEQIKGMVDVNTIVGDAVETRDGTLVIPVSKVGFGFVCGGGEYPPACKAKQRDPQTGQENSHLPFAGGVGAGVSITPIAFVVITSEDVQLVPVNKKTTSLDRAIEMLPQAFAFVKKMMKESCDKNQEDGCGKEKEGHHKRERASISVQPGGQQQPNADAHAQPQPAKMQTQDEL